MKNNSSSWLTIVVTAVVGILLIVWHGRLDVLQWIIVAMGILLAIPGAYSLIVSISSRGKSEGVSSPLAGIITGIGAVALGLWMVINPTFFVGLLTYLFAAILIVYGILQIIIVAYWSRPYVLSAWFYVIPVLLIVGGVVILCTTVREMNSIVVLITGIMLVASAINWALQYTVTHPAKRGE